MRVLVTGSEGFVGRWLVRTLLAAGHEVWAGIRPGGPLEVPGLTPAERASSRSETWAALRWLRMKSPTWELTAPETRSASAAAVAATLVTLSRTELTSSEGLCTSPTITVGASCCKHRC